MSINTELPNQADVVIIGGGIIGCSTAYYLALKGCPNVILLEKNNIGSGASGMAVTQWSIWIRSS